MDKTRHLFLLCLHEIAEPLAPTSPCECRLLSEHSVPKVIHHIGGRVLTIEVSIHADVGDMNIHCTAIFGHGAVYASY